MLLLHTAFGLTVHERALAERLAGDGISCLVFRYAERARGLYHHPARRAEVERRLAIALAGMESLIPGGARRIGVLGLSLGGALALRLAMEGTPPPPAAIVVWYGVYPDLPARMGTLTVPVLIIQGDKDRESFVQSAIAAEREARANQRDIELALYPGVGHQFDLFQPGSVATASAWRRTVDFLHRHCSS